MRTSKQFVLREIAGDTLLIPVGETSSVPQGMILLNAISLLIYQGIDAGKDLHAIVDDVLHRYDVEKEQALSDAKEAISQMESLGIIEN